MARSDEKHEPMPREGFPDRMDGEEQRLRSDQFRTMTQGRGKQQLYGSGDPSKVPGKKKPKR